MSDQIRGRTLLCKVINQALKAIIEKKESTRMFPLNKMGKQIFWMQQSTEFFLQLEYAKSEVKIADKCTRQSHGLQSSISEEAFQHITKQLEPFQWDVMASSSNFNTDSYGKPMKFMWMKVVMYFLNIWESWRVCFVPHQFL